MAFPSVASRTVGSDGSNLTTHPLNIPSGTVSGDLIIAGLSMDGNTTFTWPAGWNALSPITNSGGDGTLEVRYRVSDGSEGASINVTTAASEAGSYIMYRITNWHGTTPPEAGTPNPGSGTTPDPSSVAASWGSDDNLFIIFMGMGTSSSDVATWPTNYTNNQVQDSVSNNQIAGIAAATRNLASNTDNPGTAVTGVTAFWVANTMVVRPQGAAPSSIIHPVFSNEDIEGAVFGGKVVR